MRKRNLLFVCFLGFVVTCFMSFPPASKGGAIGEELSEMFNKAASTVTGAIAKGAELVKDVANKATDGKVYTLVVVAPGRLIKHGFKDLKQGDEIHLQIFNYDENIFEICTERRLQCATFQLDDQGKMTLIDVPVVK
jgi:hypothetical protein